MPFDFVVRGYRLFTAIRGVEPELDVVNLERPSANREADAKSAGGADMEQECEAI